MKRDFRRTTLTTGGWLLAAVLGFGATGAAIIGPDLGAAPVAAADPDAPTVTSPRVCAAAAAYAIATVENGRFDFGSFRPIQDLPNLDLDEVTPPSEEYAENYDQFGGAGFWLNANMTPHFPSAARAMRPS